MEKKDDLQIKTKSLESGTEIHGELFPGIEYGTVNVYSMNFRIAMDQQLLWTSRFLPVLLHWLL